MFEATRATHYGLNQKENNQNLLYSGKPTILVDKDHMRQHRKDTKTLMEEIAKLTSDNSLFDLQKTSEFKGLNDHFTS